ncbi:MAG: accessory factor UbiK family protein [Pseudomonadota bacterium]
MANQNPLLDDLAGLMTGAMGAARSAGEEARTLMQSQAARLIADMDLAGREEVDAIKALLTQAIERIDALEAEVAALKGAADGED